LITNMYVDIWHFCLYYMQLEKDIRSWVNMARMGVLDTEELSMLVVLLERSALTLREVLDKP